MRSATSSFARSATSPLVRLHENSGAEQLSVQSCYSPSASTSTAAPRVRPLQLLLPKCVRFNCCSPSASASTAAPRLHPLQLLLATCVRFSCCSQIVSASTAAPRLRPLVAPAVLEDSSPCPFKHSSQSSRFKYEGRASLAESSPTSRTSHFRDTHTHTC